MKPQLLFTLILPLILFISCSDDDSSGIAGSAWLQVNVTTDHDLYPEGRVYLYQLGTFESLPHDSMGIEIDFTSRKDYSPVLQVFDGDSLVRRLLPVSPYGHADDGLLTMYGEGTGILSGSSVPFYPGDGDFAFVDFSSTDFSVGASEWNSDVIYALCVVPSTRYDFVPCCLFVTISHPSLVTINYIIEKGRYRVEPSIIPEDTIDNRIYEYDIIADDTTLVRY